MGKYSHIVSPPFYTSNQGYKMCLRLYLNGDGIGKGTHMSLFFVVMKGEFDNIIAMAIYTQGHIQIDQSMWWA